MENVIDLLLETFHVLQKQYPNQIIAYHITWRNKKQHVS